jgi:hypothetical protein
MKVKKFGRNILLASSGSKNEKDMVSKKAGGKQSSLLVACFLLVSLPAWFIGEPRSYIFLRKM